MAETPPEAYVLPQSDISQQIYVVRQVDISQQRHSDICLQEKYNFPYCQRLND